MKARGVLPLTPEGSLFDARPESFGSYQVLDDLGVGRFGPVYRAQDDPANPLAPSAVEGAVAVKVFDQGLSLGQAAVLAQALERLCQAPLDHPSIVRPIAAGAEAELAWLAETCVDATPLDHVIAQVGPQPLADVLLCITQVAGALDFAAAAGVFHGALHPRDILVTGDRVFVAGLGVVQALSDAGLDVPMEGAAVSPQRALGLPPSHADDIFALAAITFEMVYGRPFEDRSKLAMVITPLTGVDHRRLVEVFEGTLADDPLERPGSALEFAAVLHQALVGRDADDRDADMLIPIRDSELRDSHANSNSDSGIPIPNPVPVTVDDLPLRGVDRVEPAADVEFESQTESGIPESRLAAASDSRHPNRDFAFESASRAQSASWFGVAAALAIGILTGFAVGFVVGQRDATPVPRSAARAVPRAQRDAAPVPNTPAPTMGQDFTESTVPEAAGDRQSGIGSGSTLVEEPAVVTPPEPNPEPRVPANRAQPSAPAPTADRLPPTADRLPPTDDRLRPVAQPASMEIVSRPAGAQVFVDGRLIGTTPLVLSAVTPGAHAVRLALPGHQRWATTVDVAAGARARVAASLER